MMLRSLGFTTTALFSLGLGIACLLSAGAMCAQTADQTISEVVTKNQYDIEGDGLKFLVDEGKQNDFFLLGEMHGDSQIPDLIRRLWPELWKHGYRHIAAEVSPWAAYQLEVAPATKEEEIRGLWTKAEATSVHALAERGAMVLWGCDMEEIQPELLIQALADLNPEDSYLQRMVSMTKRADSRKIAARLLDLAEKDGGPIRDPVINDISLRENLLMTLRIEKDRLSTDNKMIAQTERERLMKRQFLAHFNQVGTGSPGKVLLRFGRNHLHRGYDARGISTLGNFIAEFATEHGKTAFNVGAFGAEGKAKLRGETWDADVTKDEATFALLAGKAKYAATVFDLRPLRPPLHRIPVQKRSALQRNLTYWADSYAALICCFYPINLASELRNGTRGSCLQPLLLVAVSY
jgi:hypothetical protein